MHVEHLAVVRTLQPLTSEESGSLATAESPSPAEMSVGGLGRKKNPWYPLFQIILSPCKSVDL